MLWGLLLGNREGEQEPTGHEAQPADWRHGAEKSGPAQGEAIETAAEQHDACRKKPARLVEPFAGVLPQFQY